MQTKKAVSKLTRNKIAYDFEISPYYLEVPYENTTLKYIFSSELYRENFYNKYIENREKINISLSNRFGIEIESDILCDLKLYVTIEKRGFLIWKDEEKIKCLDCIKLNGMRMMKKN